MAWINTCVKHVLELLRKVVHDDYTGLARTWWHGYSWHLVHARYSCSIINLVEKMTRHKANMGKIDGVNWESVSWVPLPMYKVWWCLFIWCMSFCDMGYWWAHFTYILLYCITPGMVPTGVYGRFFHEQFLNNDNYICENRLWYGAQSFSLLRTQLTYVVGVGWVRLLHMTVGVVSPN